MSEDPLEQLLDQDSESWNPEPGAKVIGTISSMGLVPSEYGEPYPLLEIRTEGGQAIAVHCFHTVLRSAVERYELKPGDRIGIRYIGRTTEGGATGEGYEDYRVVVEDSTQALKT